MSAKHQCPNSVFTSKIIVISFARATWLMYFSGYGPEQYIYRCMQAPKLCRRLSLRRQEAKNVSTRDANAQPEYPPTGLWRHHTHRSEQIKCKAAGVQQCVTLCFSPTGKSQFSSPRHALSPSLIIKPRCSWASVTSAWIHYVPIHCIDFVGNKQSIF